LLPTSTTETTLFFFMAIATRSPRAFP